ncbi:MAG TPA: cation diffusion facilitator family transporter [Lactobacillaceae bacterium]|jgi:cobalt-zinc-cadmium efflux system protein
MAHDHMHNSTPAQTPYLIGAGLNTAFIIGEMIFAKIAHSSALFADALHSVSDVASLCLAWAAVAVFGIKASSKRTYGWHNTTILASFVNAVLLLVAVAVIWWEAVAKLLAGGAPTQGLTVMWVALVGIIVNFVAARFFSHDKDDLNARGAYVHLLADAGVSVGVVVSGLLIKLTDWYWLDPVVSLLIGLIIIVTSWDIFKQSLNLLVNGVPAGVDEPAVAAFLTAQEDVLGMHDLHIWGLSTTEVALTVHLLVPAGKQQQVLDDITAQLQRRFHIQHLTIQVETQKPNHEYHTI